MSTRMGDLSGMNPEGMPIFLVGLEVSMTRVPHKSCVGL